MLMIVIGCQMKLPFHFHLCKDRDLYPANLSITIEGGNKLYSDKTRPSITKTTRRKTTTQGSSLHTQKNEATDSLTSTKHKEGKHTTTHNETEQELTTTGH